MPLFQSSVLNKYLKAQDKTTIAARWAEYKNYFLNPAIQENIRNLKEEEFQEGFVRELFVNVLGYTLNPQPQYNFVLEKKNVKDSKKADGAILANGRVTAVLELKGTDTIDLGKIEPQAFGYKNNQPDCAYVITSNFEKLRFYIDNAVEHLEFSLFTLTEDEFRLLHLCLSHDNIAMGLPKKIKNESVSREDAITKKLYKDYSQFKRELYQNLVALNPGYDPLLLFKKSQKLLDRFLFIFFAEDRDLLPTNLIFRINKEWKQLREMRIAVSLYDRYKIYFNDLNTGARVTLPAFSETAALQKEEHQIYAYNGGLFKEDEVLDNIVIDDDLLYGHTQKMSHYNFGTTDYTKDSEIIDVNILGHIFENSLNELDEIKAQLEGQAIEKAKTKRKKDGVFYTPKYITKYIVDNTIGKLCDEKKKALEITDENYQPAKQRSRKRLDNLQQYRQWLLELTICDPACGSGAFLNQALEFLIAEHRYIDELSASYNKDALVLSDVEDSILENNLFGVDLNEESVEIAKLSLWLRTAKPNRKLNDLSSNIKCGNSLIDDPEVAGDKAFNWQQEFPQVFANGGFDVVIGNPPYVLCQPSNTHEDHLQFYKSFIVASYKIDLFHLFFEKSILLLKVAGKLGFITPNTYLSNKYIQPLRNFILSKTFVDALVNYNESVFADAGVDVATIILTNKSLKNKNIKVLVSDKAILNSLTSKSQSEWESDPEQIFNINPDFNLNTANCTILGLIVKTYFGIQAYDRKSAISETKIDSNYLELIDGGDVHRYRYSIPQKYFNYVSTNIKSGGDWEIYLQDRIVVRQIGKTPIVGFCASGILTSNTIYNLSLIDKSYSLKFLLSILNSKLLQKYWMAKYNDSKELFPKIKGYQLRQLPIINTSSSNQVVLADKSEAMLTNNLAHQEIIKKFNRTIQRKFNLDDLPKKLQDWYLLSYGEFIKELGKKKIKLGLAEEAEWEDYFEQEKTKALELKAKIDATDREIDQMVYELYGLTPEEIEIVENS